MNHLESPAFKNEEDPNIKDMKKLDCFENNMLNPLLKVNDLKANFTEKGSLAWLLERISINNPETWEKDLEKIKNEMDRLNQEGGKKLVCQNLCEKINEEYIDFLKNLMENEKIETDYKTNLETSIRICQNKLKRLEQAKIDGSIIRFGIVANVFFPKWFPQDKYKDEEDEE